METTPLHAVQPPACSSQWFLTAKETAVMEQLLYGTTNKQIAIKLGVTEHTIKTHIGHIFVKANIFDRVPLAKAAEGLQKKLNGAPSASNWKLTELLTRRQADILVLIIKGNEDKETAKVLGISLHIIKREAEKILLKFGADNRVHLAVIHEREIGDDLSGFVGPDPPPRKANPIVAGLGR